MGGCPHPNVQLTAVQLAAHNVQTAPRSLARVQDDRWLGVTAPPRESPLPSAGGLSTGNAPVASFVRKMQPATQPLSRVSSVSSLTAENTWTLGPDEPTDLGEADANKLSL